MEKTEFEATLEEKEKEKAEQVTLNETLRLSCLD